MRKNCLFIVCFLLGCSSAAPQPTTVDPNATVPVTPLPAEANQDLEVGDQPNAVAQDMVAPNPASTSIDEARALANGGSSNFGTISLDPGFMPDPHVAGGRSGGSVEASSLGAGCRGWISTTPDHIFQAGGPFPFLIIAAEAAGNEDTTLVIRKPDGTYLCDDDSGSGNNPLVVGTGLEAGAYQIFIGSYSQGENAEYSLSLSERPPAPEAHPVSRSAPAIPDGSNFAALTIAPGFMPDPNITQGTSGGQIQASEFNPSCRGWITPRPDHILTAAADFPFLKFLVNSDNDTTLVIQRPDGQFYCDDDSGDGNHPLIMGPMAAGDYKVWVGSYREGENSPYRIAVTERPSLGTGGI